MEPNSLNVPKMYGVRPVAYVGGAVIAAACGIAAYHGDYFAAGGWALALYLGVAYTRHCLRTAERVALMSALLTAAAHQLRARTGAKP